MNHLRFIKADHSYADFSTSLSPAVEQAVEEKHAQSTIILNIFREGSFTVGGFDDPVKCLDLDYCKKEKIVVRRRQNSGGAIWGPKGSAFIVIIVDTTLPFVPIKTVENAFQIILGSFSQVVRDLYGIDTRYRPLNDVEINGKKLMASSARLEKGILTLRLLINVVPTDRTILSNAIQTPVEKMQDKKIKDVGKRFTCLEDEVGRKIESSDLMKITEMAVEKIFGKDVELTPGLLSDIENKYATTYQKKYTSHEWLYANSEDMRFKDISSDTVKTEGRHKALAGLIRATLLISQNKFQDLIITGDFHPTPFTVLEDIENALRGKTCDIKIVSREVEKIFKRPDVEIAGTTPLDFVKAFEKAFQGITADSAK